MRKPPKELARRLVDASQEVLRPDQELRLEDIAGLVGSARATLYYYFSGRDDLIAFLLEEHLSSAAGAIDAAIAPTEPADAQLRSAVAALIEFLGRHPGVCAALLSFAATAGRMATVLAAKDAMLVVPLRQILSAGAADGLFAIDDPRDAANAILGAIMITILGRWHNGTDATAADFQSSLTSQIVRGVHAD